MTLRTLHRMPSANSLVGRRLANELQYDLALVEAWEAGQQSVPERLAQRLGALANAYHERGTPTAYRGWGACRKRSTWPMTRA